MGLSTTEKLSRLRLIRSDNIGPVTFRQLLDRFGSAEDALLALPDMAKKGGRRRVKICPLDIAKKEVNQTLELGAGFCFKGNPEYPAALASLPDAPPVLITLGDQSLLQKSILGMVGARNASAAGAKFSRNIAHDLGKEGIVVASGMARGIDTAAHQGSLETGTIAVIAGGIDIIYPPENDQLYQDIAAQGLIICELPIGTRPVARHFPQRNRLISGISKGVLVVEAALRSGSLITARNAGEQGRDVFAVPGSPLDPRHRGTNDLLRQGAALVETADDILEVMNGSLFTSGQSAQPAPETAPHEHHEGDGFSNARHQLLEKLSATPIDVDELIRQCGLTPGLVLTILLELEIAGRLERHAGNRVALI